MTAQERQQQLDQTWKYRIKRWRRGLRARLSLWAAKRFGTAQARPATLAKIPGRILVVRLNKRLGNILFLTPLLSSLAATFPQTRIDVLLRDAAHASLLRNLPNMGEVWVLPQKPALRPLNFIDWVKRLRARDFDLVIDPNINSASNRIGTWLCGARQRLGFAGPDQWLHLDYAAPVPHDIPHQALQALQLFKEGITQHQPELVEEYRVAPNNQARAAGHKYWQNAFAGKPPSTPVIGFFAQATGAKNLGLHWWQAWLAAMQADENAPVLLQLLPPGDTPALQPGLAHVRVAALDELAATLSHLHLFVAADSGPMHLAAAAGTPTLGLFTATDPDDYRPLGPGCSTVHGDALTPDEVAAQALAKLQTLANAPGS